MLICSRQTLEMNKFAFEVHRGQSTIFCLSNAQNLQVGNGFGAIMLNESILVLNLAFSRNTPNLYGVVG